MSNNIIAFLIITILLIYLPSSTQATSGCCSQHGGETLQCSQDAKRIVCKDGTVSPSCICTTSSSTSVNSTILSSNANNSDTPMPAELPKSGAVFPFWQSGIGAVLMYSGLVLRRK